MNRHPAPPPVLLASASPRRRRLLAWLSVPFDIASVDTPEDMSSPLSSNPAALAKHLAAEKALAARAEGLADDRLVLCFDTIVAHNGRVLGKPVDVEDAWSMLRSLSGQTHQVVTGCAWLCPGDDEPRTFAVTTDVRMVRLSDEQITAWMAVGEFMGCAGAYNIEGQVAEVTDDECYQNVAGLPLCHLYAELAGHGAPECLPSAPSVPVGACNAALGRHCRLGPQVSAIARSASPQL